MPCQIVPRHGSLRCGWHRNGRNRYQPASPPPPPEPTVSLRELARLAAEWDNLSDGELVSAREFAEWVRLAATHPNAGEWTPRR